jgi:HEAT repeat protein
VKSKLQSDEEIVEWAKALADQSLGGDDLLHVLAAARGNVGLQSSMAAWVLGRTEIAEADIEPVAETLIAIVDDQANAVDVRNHAAESLGELLAYSRNAEMRGRAVDSLVGGTRDSNESMRGWCAFALGQLSATEAIAAISALLDDDSTTKIIGDMTVRDIASDTLELILGN